VCACIHSYSINLFISGDSMCVCDIEEKIPLIFFGILFVISYNNILCDILYQRKDKLISIADFLMFLFCHYPCIRRRMIECMRVSSMREKIDYSIEREKKRTF